MILGLLLMTAGQYQQQQNWFVVMMAGSGLKSAKKKEKVMYSANKLPCMDRGLT